MVERGPGQVVFPSLSSDKLQVRQGGASCHILQRGVTSSHSITAPPTSLPPSTQTPPPPPSLDPLHCQQSQDADFLALANSGTEHN